jgi:hypothetical protein
MTKVPARAIQMVLFFHEDLIDALYFDESAAFVGFLDATPIRADGSFCFFEIRTDKMIERVVQLDANGELIGDVHEAALLLFAKNFSAWIVILNELHPACLYKSI